MSGPGYRVPDNTPSATYNAAGVTLADKQLTALQCDANGQLKIAGTINAATTGKATAAAPTYVEGSTDPLSMDLSGNLRVAATVSANVTAVAASTPPSYSAGAQPFSQDLSGHLRTISEIDQTTPGTTNAVDVTNFPATVDVNTGNASNNTPRVVLASNQPAVAVTGTFYQATQPISAASLPLPSGAATSALQSGIQAVVAAGTAPANCAVSGGIYNSSPLTLTNTQSCAAQVDANGYLKVNVAAGGAGGGAVFGPTAVGSAAANPPVLFAGTANAGATGNVQVAKVDSSGNVYTSTILTAGSALIGKAGIDQTTPGTTNGVALAQIGSTTTDANSGNKSAGTQRVILATDSVAIPTWGHGATGSAVPAGATYKGLIAKTANPSAASDGNLVGAMADKLGRQVVVVGNVRDLKGNQFTTITASTSETTVVTAVASTFLDVYGCIVENTSATATKVTFKDSTAGTTQFEIYVPAGDTRGFMLPSSDGFKQTTVNTNWTATCGTSVSSVVISMLYVKNI